MKVGIVASHYPHPEHREEFIARVHEVAAAFRQTPGCLSAECWYSAETDAVVSTVQWQSEQSRDASLATLTTLDHLDTNYDTRERRPREVLQLAAC